MSDMDAVIQNNMHRYKRLNERKIEKVMREYNLRKIDLEIMIYLKDCGGKNTAKDIAATEMFTKGHISQSVSRMRDFGYIEVKQDEKDLRLQHLKLTEGAKRILEDVMSVKQEVEECVFSGITEDEICLLQRVLQKINSNISAALEKNY